MTAEEVCPSIVVLVVAANLPGWVAGGTATVKAEPTVPGSGVDGYFRGTPEGLEGPQRAAMRPSWTANGQLRPIPGE